MDEQKLNEFIGKILGDLGGAYSIPMVRIGDRLGLYKALKTKPMTIEQLASSTKIDERYAREWLSHQAASGYLDIRCSDTTVYVAARTGGSIRG